MSFYAARILALQATGLRAEEKTVRVRVRGAGMREVTSKVFVQHGESYDSAPYYLHSDGYWRRRTGAQMFSTKEEALEAGLAHATQQAERVYVE